MSASESQPPDGRHVVLNMCLLLAVAVMVVFSQTVRYQCVDYDDGDYFFSNSHVQSGLTWHNVAWAFQTKHASNWHPLTWLSLMLDVELFGTDPAGPHLTNAFLHAASTVLLFLWLKRLTGAYWRSALVAALFGLHPLHVESVAWISERKDTLSGLFFMLTLLMYARYVQSDAKHQMSGVRSWVSGSYWLAVLFFVLGLMSKPMLVTLPFGLLLLDYWPLRRIVFPTLNPGSSRANSHSSNILHLCFEKLPFFALSAASSAATLVAQKEAVQPLAHISLSIRTMNAIVSYAQYLHKMCWPVNLAIPYPHYGYPPLWLFGLSVTLILATSLVVMRWGRQLPFLVTGWLWYLGMLVPVIGLVQVGTQSMADRYTYLPLIGMFIVLAWGAGIGLERWRVPRPAITVMAILMLSACAARTMDQLRYWQNTETLFRHTITVETNNDVAYYNLGEYYFSQGRVDMALDCYSKAIELRPTYDDALNNLGVALAGKGKLNEAIARIRDAIHYNPDKADAYYNLGNIFVMQHKLGEAVSAYQEALQLKPAYPEAHNNLANVLVMQGHTDEAIRHYQETLRLNPAHDTARRQLRALGVETP